MQKAIERAIATMWDRYDQPLSLAEVADTAILSRFYFSRVFRTVTGTSPGRFLAAIRLQRAKNILLESTLSVTDISYRVGYNSPGTFTSRFTGSVGMSPTRYRWMSHVGMTPMPEQEPPVRMTAPSAAGRAFGAVHGRLDMPQTDTPMRIYVGAFNGPIAQGLPVSCDILESSGSFLLNAVPTGTWYIRAVAVAVRDVDPRPWARRPLLVGAGHPVEIRAGLPVKIDITMHPTCTLDLPVLLALPELDSRKVPELTRRIFREPRREPSDFELVS
ncbi:MAG TPA: helix-turn-helix transcriptional regulator [Actinocrinis sp.]|nr:helix-turn-helix transcriptional regulator [Actinocrinis sp.]